MPATSGKQYRAMAAAMSGHSTRGIPQSVGREFVEGTPAKKRRAWAKKKRRKHARSERYEMLKRMAEE